MIHEDWQGPDISINEALKAVAFTTGIPLKALDGYVVIGISGQTNYCVVSNACCRHHSLAILSDVITQSVQQPTADCPGAG